MGDLEDAIRRMREILDTGRWPTGIPITARERETVEWNLELAKTERARRRAREAAPR